MIALSGLFEGLAIVLLVPILHILSGKGVADDGLFLTRYLLQFNLSDNQLLSVAVGSFILLGVIAATLRLFSDNGVLWVRSHIEKQLRTDMSNEALNMSWAHFVTMQLGDLSKAIVEEGFRVGIGCYSFLHALGAISVVGFFLILSFIVSTELTLYTLIFGALGVLCYLLFNKLAIKHSSGLSSLQSEIGNQATELFGNMKFFRASGESLLAKSEINKVFSSFANSFYWSQAYGSVVRFIFESVAVLFVSSFLLVNHFGFQKPLESILVFLTLFYRLSPRILRAQEELMRARTYLSWYQSYRERMVKMRAFPDERISDINKEEARHFNNRISLKNINFTYPGAIQPALKGVSLEIKQGECVAIVGASGSGKSTLLDIILGLLTPNHGDISVDNISLKNLKIDSWRNRLGIVTQDTPVFFGTVLDNIAWGFTVKDLIRAEEAAKLAYAWEFIEKLPHGLKSVVGEKGGRLSGGQKQRLAIARALYRDPWCLIFDEATSALDEESEGEVQQALHRLKGSRAMIVVAHRLKSVRLADRIVVMDKGEIVEEGSWNELVQREDGIFNKYRTSYLESAA